MDELGADERAADNVKTPFVMGVSPISASPMDSPMVRGRAMKDYATFDTLTLAAPPKKQNPLRLCLSSAAEIPATLVSVLLILLNSIAFGLLMFPACIQLNGKPVAPIGISMCLLSVLVSQPIYSSLSKFKCTNSLMISENGLASSLYFLCLSLPLFSSPSYSPSTVCVRSALPERPRHIFVPCVRQ
jgi:hypothetical protein